jgi:hypothetical protein
LHALDIAPLLFPSSRRDVISIETGIIMNPIVLTGHNADCTPSISTRRISPSRRDEIFIAPDSTTIAFVP